MIRAATPVSAIRFDGFEADLQSGELRRSGLPVKLQEQPFQILAMLLERPGELVTREQIHQRLWPADTFVDFEHSINTAIMRLREALGDDAEHHRFVETLPRRGYRFIGPLETAPRAFPDRAPAGGNASPPAPVHELGPQNAGHRAGRRLRLLLLGASFSVFLGVALALNSGEVRDRLLALVGAGRIASHPRVDSIAVLPLANLTGDSGQDYFAEGMTDTLISDLGRIRSLRVISRQSTMRYRGSVTPMPEIARELDVDGIIVGTFQRSRGRVRITAQLFHARTDRLLWSESYERDLTDILALERDVSFAVAHEVEKQLDPQQATRLLRGRPVNPEAYEDYLRGRYRWSQWPEGWDKATESFRRAAEKDPGFGPALAGFSMATSLSAVNRPRDEVYSPARTAAESALRLDPALSEAHLATAFSALFLEWDWAKAEREAISALQLNPNDPEAHAFYAMYLAYVGRHEESIGRAKRARELDPFCMFTNLVVVETLMYSGKSQEAVAEATRTLELNPLHPGALSHLAESYALLGNFDAARAQAEKMGGGCALPLVVANAASHRQQLAMACITQNEEYARRHYVSPFWLAVPHVALGEKDRAFELLSQAYEERAGAMAMLKTEPYFRPLHNDPRFQELVRRMNFPQ